MKMSRIACSLALGLLLAPVVFAQTDPVGGGGNEPGNPTTIEEQNAILSEQGNQAYGQQHDKLIKSAEAVGALGPDLFGDSTNFYTGATQFQHTDLVLPGNSGLTVGVSRRLDVSGGKYGAYLREFGDWELDVPYIGGVFTELRGWAVSVGNADSGGSQFRCSAPTTLVEAQPIAVESEGAWFDFVEYWQGYSLFVPGVGEQQVLFGNLPASPVPSSAEYRWVTNAFWQLGCTPSVVGGVGDGFVALSPDGTRYFLNHMVRRPERRIGKYDSPGEWAVADREEIRLYVTQIKDRFNNEVNYHWDGDRLSWIDSPDGRRIDFDYENDRIKTARTAGLSVSYQYQNPPTTNPTTPGASLHYVTYADGSRWVLDMKNVYADHFYDCSTLTNNTDPFRCWDPASPHCGFKRLLSTGLPRVGTMTHPSGAIGRFGFKYKRHVRASVPDDSTYCPSRAYPSAPGWPNQTEGIPDEPWDFVSLTPRVFDVLAMVNKSIDGVGLGTGQAWTYEYQNIQYMQQPPYLYDPETGEWEPNDEYDEDEYAAPVRKVVTTEPGAVRRVLTFGNRYDKDEGHLLKVEIFDDRIPDSPVLVQTATSTYVFKEELSQPAYPFPDRVGTNPLWTQDNIWSEWLLPLRKEQTEREQVTYVREIQQFDQFVNPTRVQRSNSLGSTRTDVTTYGHNLTKWVLGLVTNETNVDTGREVSRTVYDPNTALPLQQYSFGMPTPSVTFDYHADGNLRTAWDGLSHPTTLSSYKRGVPQVITFANNQSIEATVDDLGRIEDTTDVFDTLTDYNYDAMGRLTEVNYEADGALIWTPRRLGFSKVGSQYGIGNELENELHWQQVSRAENNSMVTTTHYDALWRPILIITEANDASPSYVVKRYNERGQEEFSSYPVDSIDTIDDNLKGVHTEYDALGRVKLTKVDADGGAQLPTQTNYLPGLKTEVINPRGTITTTTYQAYDAPSYDAPILIESKAAPNTPPLVTTTITRDKFGKPRSVTRTGPGG